MDNLLMKVDYYVKGKKVIAITLAEAKRIMKESEEATAILTEIIKNNTNNTDFLKSHTNPESIKKDAKLVVDKKGRKYVSYKSLEYEEKKEKYLLDGVDFYPSKEDNIKRWGVNKYLIK